MRSAWGDACFQRGGGSCLPDTDAFPIQDQDCFLVLATNGVWDVMEPTEVVQFVEFFLCKPQGQLSAADALTLEALQRWKARDPQERIDDVSAVIVPLPGYRMGEPIGCHPGLPNVVRAAAPTTNLSANSGDLGHVILSLPVSDYFRWNEEQGKQLPVSPGRDPSTRMDPSKPLGVVGLRKYPLRRGRSLPLPCTVSGVLKVSIPEDGVIDAPVPPFCIPGFPPLPIITSVLLPTREAAAAESRSPGGFSGFCSFPMGTGFSGTGFRQGAMGPRAASTPALLLAREARLPDLEAEQEEDWEEDEEEDFESPDASRKSSPESQESPESSHEARWGGWAGEREGRDGGGGSTLLQRLLSHELSLADVEKTCSAELANSLEGRVRGGLHLSLPATCHLED
eukprot:jgi/Botrbrau1/17078/Bobra.0285s0005.1